MTKECYQILHSQIPSDEEVTWCGKIINNLWRNASQRSEEQHAFAVSICEFFLNPDIETLRNDNDYLKRKIKQIKVSKITSFNLTFEYVQNLNIFFIYIENDFQ